MGITKRKNAQPKPTKRGGRLLWAGRKGDEALKYAALRALVYATEGESIPFRLLGRESAFAAAVLGGASVATLQKTFSLTLEQVAGALIRISRDCGPPAAGKEG